MDTGAALAAANAVMHAASVAATQKIALEAQGRNALGQFTTGESADTARGRETHNNYEAALGPAYKYNRQIPGTKLRPDAIDWTNRIVRELKPDTASTLAKGRTQLEKYKQALEEFTKLPWTSYLDVYKK